MQCNKYYCNATNSPPHCQIPAVARHFVPSPLACGVYLDLEQAPFHPPEPEAPQRREPAPAGRAAKENDQPGFAGWRRAWRFHLGSARPDSGRRTARGGRHLRQLGRRTECGDARRRARARRAAGGAAPSCRFLARRELRRQPAGFAARRAGAVAVVPAGPACAAAVAWAVPGLVALRSQPAQHQSTQGSDRAFRGFHAVAQPEPTTCSSRPPTC